MANCLVSQYKLMYRLWFVFFLRKMEYIHLGLKVMFNRAVCGK